MKLPRELSAPMILAHRVVQKVGLDLTVYLAGPTVPELEALIDAYESVCPPDLRKKYKIAEQEWWSEVAKPNLTESGREAAAKGAKRPYLEPVRRRIRDERAFEIQFWDGRSIGDASGSWSFNCRALKLQSSGLHAFIRVLWPLDVDPKVIRTLAGAFADVAGLRSGHAGLAFLVDPWYKEEAFETVYAKARRFWGVDIEYLRGTLPLTKKGIKGVGWLTILGSDFAAKPAIAQALEKLAGTPGVEIEQRKHAVILVAGAGPVAGDQNRPGPALDPLFAVAKALKPLFLKQHPDIPGQPFIDHGNTVGWIRRFVEPAGWR